MVPFSLWQVLSVGRELPFVFSLVPIFPWIQHGFCGVTAVFKGSPQAPFVTHGINIYAVPLSRPGTQSQQDTAAVFKGPFLRSHSGTGAVACLPVL